MNISLKLPVLRTDVLESYEQLIELLQQLSIAIQEDQCLPVWAPLSDYELQTGMEMRIKVTHLYSALWYEDGQDGRDTINCPGLVGVGSGTIQAIQSTNGVKDAFKNAVLALKSVTKTEANSVMAELNRRNEEVAKTMRRMGAARLNLKQAYRRIPLLEERPLKVGFTWSKQGRTIQRTTVAQVRGLLERRMITPQLQAEMERLGSIPSSEVLARVRTVCPHLRANVVFINDNNNLKRRLIQAPIPIAVSLRPGEQLPDFVPVDLEPAGGRRLQRSDMRLEDEAFLPSLRVFRYRKSCRR